VNPEAGSLTNGAFSIAGKKILVTGPGGFVGRALLPVLCKEGAILRGFMRNALEPSQPDIDMRRGDIADPAAVREAVQGCDAAIHLAGLASVPDSLRDPASFFRTNVTGTFNLLEACRNGGVAKLIYVSSSQVYGPPRGKPIDEDHPLDPATPYAAFKIGAECLVRAYGRSYGLATVVLRPFNIYGPGQSRATLVPSIVTQVLAGGDLRLGKIDLTRDLTFVDDVARAIVCALTAADAPGLALNVGSGRGVTVEAIARLILEQMGSHAAIVSESGRMRNHEPAGEAVVADVRRAAAILGWTATISLEEGLRRTIDFYRDRRA
jgi:dTDP-glucose 4,6-dehydratase